MPRHVRPHVAHVISRMSVELVRNDRESDIIASVETAKNLEKGTPKGGVTRTTRRERRREVWSLQVARRRAKRGKGRVAYRVWIAITQAGRAAAWIGFTDPGNGSPEIVIVFRF